MTLAIGLDIGGTKIAGALVRDGEILERARVETPADEVGHIIDAVVSVIEMLQREAAGEEIAGAGIACAGFVDVMGEHVLFAPNLAWRNEPVRAQVMERVDLPVRLENDANAAAWGEFRHGSAKEFDDMTLITVGTGIGGGIVHDGVLLRGAAGIGAEIGHMRVVREGHRCGCGNRGCWEQYASGTALVREARELIRSGTPHAERLAEICGGDPEQLSGEDITGAAEQGDPAARELLHELGVWLGEGAASIAAILDPAAIVIGGGVSAAGDLLLAPTQRAFERHLTGRGHRPWPQVVLAGLGNDAGVIGAATIMVDAPGTSGAPA
ncbi:glucokinase [Kytococcus aerolatus]|uniref:Glucokinase n=1 Tax=Kytococcus aerolatus TaxID=592308 RepID=A0A212T3X1_9MICO|nr:ROK family glucokinase [Kytococcus aerolatus]SNC60705.1 glucokinase [Kytococcus aerolatus]